VEYCKKNNIVVQAYAPLLRGALDDPVIQELAAKVIIYISSLKA
jgi:diketogulonate reductase-like aldo/keto reductase